jgi:hypothetical protein
MKKSVLIISAVAALAMAGQVAAQEVTIGGGTLKFGGKIMTGLEATFDNDKNEDGIVRMYNDSEGTDLRVELSTAYTNGNVGFMTRFRADDAEVGKAAVGVRYAFGWIDLFDGMFRPTAGLLDLNSNVWGTKGDLDVDVAGAGLRLEVKPVAGLNFGVFFRVPNQAVNVNQTGGYHSANTTVDGESVPQNTTAKAFLNATAFGLGYENSDLYVRLQYLIDTDPIDHARVNDDTDPDNDADATGTFDFGLGYTGLKSLEAHVEGRIKDPAKFENGNVDLRQVVKYTISDELPLTVGVAAREVLYGDNTKIGADAADPWVQIKPSVAYKVNKDLTVSLGGGYGFGLAGQNDGVLTESDIYVTPKLEYNFGNGFATKFFYTYDINTKKGLDAVNKSTIALELTYQF